MVQKTERGDRMKRKTVILMLLFMILLPGCSREAAMPEQVSFSESKQTSLSESAPVEESAEKTVLDPSSLRRVQSKLAESEPAPAEEETGDSADAVIQAFQTEKKAETLDQPAAEPLIPDSTENSSETESSFRNVTPPADEEPQEEPEQEKGSPEENTETENETESHQPESEPEEPEEQTTELPEDEPEEVSEPETETEQELESEQEPEFDIGHWIGYAKSLAENKGLILNSDATECWDNPITANAGCVYLERDLNSRLNRYAGDDEITDVWIWYEDLGNQHYLIYIGYA